MADQPVEGTARRGRRDPEVAQRIRQRRPAQETPPGEIEVFPAAPLENAEDDLQGEGEFNPEDLPMLLPGDVVLAKVTHSAIIDESESWFSYGAQSRVQPYETEEDAFARVCAVSNGRALDLIRDAEERVAEEKELRAAEEAARAAARARQPIRPQRRP